MVKFATHCRDTVPDPRLARLRGRHAANGALPTDSPQRPNAGAMKKLGITRRRLLASTPILAVAGFGLPALGRSYRGGSLPWEPNDTSPPIPVQARPVALFHR